MSLAARLKALVGGGRPGFLGRDLSVAFFGHSLAKGLGSLTFLLMTRTLSPSEYGLYTLAYGVFEIGLYLSDLGLDTGTTRFVARGLREKDDALTQGVLKSVFLLKLLMGALVFIVGYATAPFVANEILTRPEMVPFLRISYVGIFGMQLYRFYSAYFTARLEFGHNAVFSSLTPAAILVAMFGVWRWGHLDALACMRIYSVMPLLACALATIVLPHDFLRAKTQGLKPLRPVWRFSRWIYLTNVTSTVRFRLNGLLLARYATMADVGYYGYADKLAATITLFTNTILTVLVPHASHMLTQEELRSLLKRSYKATLVLAPFLLLVPFGSHPIIGILAPDYLPAAPIFAVIFVSVVFSLVALPSSTVLYSVNRPEVETVVDVVALVVTLAGGLLIVRSHGAFGVAMVMLVQRLLSAVLLMGYVYLRVYRASPDSFGSLDGGAAA